MSICKPQAGPRLGAERVLLVEDADGDAALVAEYLAITDAAPVSLSRARTLAEALGLLAQEQPFDVALLDLGLPDAHGTGGLERLRALAPDLPIVVLTGMRAASGTGTKAVARGAQDYLDKNEIDPRRLVRAIRYAVERQRLLTRLEQTATALREREQDLRRVLEGHRDGMVIVDDEGTVLFANHAAQRLLGHGLTEVVARLEADDHGADRTAELDWACEDGTRRPLAVRWVDLSWTHRAARLLSLQDLTEQRQAQRAALESERRLLQAQKMEAVGALAGGVAHDVNNLLMILMGGIESLRARRPEDGDALDLLELCVGQMTQLTQRLLVVSDCHVGPVETVDAGRVVQDLGVMLQSTLGDGIHLEIEVPPEAAFVPFVAGGLEQVLVNLALNSRDAMAGQGAVRLEIAEDVLQDGDGPPVPAWRLTFCDDGPGVPAALRGRIFDPYVSSKASGHGLGLASVNALVRHAGGTVQVGAREPHGTAVLVRLPRAAAPAGAAPVEEPRADGRLALRSCLLVDDREDVRHAVAMLLRSLGLDVVEAEDARQALAHFAEAEAVPELLVTDLVMPGMSGTELAEALVREHPDLRVLFVSGYPDAEEPRRIGPARTALLQKPFTRERLRAALGRLA
jgi:PAS domain S-box-containing protein